MSTEARIAEVQKRLFLPNGGHVVVRSDQPQARPRVQMIPYLEDLKQGPHRLPQVSTPSRLIAYCCVCQKTITNLPAHVETFKEHPHAIRYMLVPDLRGGA